MCVQAHIVGECAASLTLALLRRSFHDGRRHPAGPMVGDPLARLGHRCRIRASTTRLVFVFESLSDRLTGALQGLRGKGRLTDADIDATTREIRLALLEADVSLPGGPGVRRPHQRTGQGRGGF